MKSLAELALEMHDNIDLSNEAELKKYMGFTPVGEMITMIRKTYPAGHPNAPGGPPRGQRYNLEIGPNGITKGPRYDFGMFIMHSGTPHHVQHQFGHWHINDVDEIYIGIPGATPQDPTTRIIMMRHPKPGERDIFAWYCQNCVSMIHSFVLDSGNLGWESFWKAEDVATREFNGDPKVRQCKNCGWDHPLAYRFRANKNTPEEETARSLW